MLMGSDEVASIKAYRYLDRRPLKDPKHRSAQSENRVRMSLVAETLGQIATRRAERNSKSRLEEKRLPKDIASDIVGTQAANIQ